MNRPPAELGALLAATSDAARDRAWERFVARHSRLLLKVAHETGGRYDGAMDHYAFVLERLRAGDFQRLRRYEPDGRTKFTTWLVVVARRLCLDHHRRAYGRPRTVTEKGTEEQEARRRLVDFVMDEIDPERTVNHRTNGKTDAPIRRKELSESLAEALATLSEEDRLTLRLRFEDDAPVSDIAKVLDVPTVFHVYRRLKRTLAHLRVELERRGVDGPRP